MKCTFCPRFSLCWLCFESASSQQEDFHGLHLFLSIPTQNWMSRTVGVVEETHLKYSNVCPPENLSVPKSNVQSYEVHPSEVYEESFDAYLMQITRSPSSSRPLGTPKIRIRTVRTDIDFVWRQKLDNISWTTGQQPGISAQKFISRGGSGMVYKVLHLMYSITNGRCTITIQRKYHLTYVRATDWNRNLHGR